VRTLQVRSLNTDAVPAVRTLAGETEYVWSLSDVPALVFEDDTPAWFNPVPRIQMSEFGSWEEVVAWALPLYGVEGPLSPALAKQIEAWRSLEDPERRLVEAVRFVQDEVRYLGIELGPYSHLPTGPSTVFERRFGDCKDKALLLVTVLGALGIEAYPALVNTDARQALEGWQPSPYAFDHVIVMVVLGDRALWIDATINLQRGGLPQFYNPPYARALVIRPGSRELAIIPPATSDAPTIDATTVYCVDPTTGSATLDVVTTYRGSDADEMRFELSRHSRAEVGRSFLNFYSLLDPDIEPEGLPRIDDDPMTNTVVITERYFIPRFWRNGARRIVADRIEEELDTPRISRRTMPLAVSFPVHVAQRIEVRLGRDPGVDEDTSTTSDGVTQFSYKCTVDGSALVLEYTLRTLRDNVPPTQVATHLASLETIRKALEFEIDEQSTEVAVGTWLWLSIMACFVLAPIGIGLITMRKKPAPDPLLEPIGAGPIRRTHEARSVEPTRTESGLRPDAAIPLAHADVGRHVSSLACACGRRYSHDAVGGDAQSLTFDGRKMIVVDVSCPSCGSSRDMYFVPGGS
jgi:transglutaminase-like putative cysteine protease